MRISSVKTIISTLHKQLEECNDLSCVPERILDLVVIDESNPSKDVVWKIVEYLKDESTSIPGELVYTQKDLNTVKTNLSVVDGELQQYMTKITELSNQIDELSFHITRLREELRQIEDQYMSYEEDRTKRLTELESLINEKTQELASLSKSEAVEPEYYAKIEKELEDLKAEYATIKATPNPYRDKEKKAIELADMINKQKELVEVLEGYKARLKNLQKQSDAYRRELESIMKHESEPKISVDELRAGMLDAIANVSLPEVEEDKVGPFNARLIDNLRVAVGISNYFKQLIGIDWPWVLKFPDVSDFINYVLNVGFSIYVFK